MKQRLKTANLYSHARMALGTLALTSLLSCQQVAHSDPKLVGYETRLAGSQSAIVLFYVDRNADTLYAIDEISDGLLFADKDGLIDEIRELHGFSKLYPPTCLPKSDHQQMYILNRLLSAEYRLEFAKGELNAAQRNTACLEQLVDYVKQNRKPDNKG